MLIVISPAKSLDFKSRPATQKYTLPDFLNEASEIAGKLKTFSPEQISGLMSVSPKLGQLNWERYQVWHLPFTPENARQAVLAFSGEVFRGLQANSLSESQFGFAQKHLRILSGLYGVLRPLDLIQPYRLEMGMQLSIGKKKDLYHFWGKAITEKISEALKESGFPFLINLASSEYYKSIDVKKAGATLITPAFKDLKNGAYKMITVYAKRARGLMTRFIIENNIINPEELKAFNSEGYMFNPRLSEPYSPVFTRDK